MAREERNVRNSISKLVHLIENNLGHCPRCIKTAFLCASIGWLAVLAAQLVWPAGAAGTLIFLVAIGCTALWLLHFAAYTARILAALWSENIAGAVPGDSDGKRHGTNRRNVLWVFGSALSLGVMAALWLPTPAFAAGSPCGTGRSCPDSAPRCCSRSKGKCCDGNWACTTTGSCHASHSDARKRCGTNGIVWACI